MLCVFALVAPHGPWNAYLAGVLAFAFVSAEVLLVAALTPRLEARSLAWLTIPIAALVGVALAGSALPALGAAGIVTLALLLVGTLAGGVIGNAIEIPGHLIVVAVVSALVDTFSVMHPSGPTAQLIEIEAAVNILVLPWPMLGTTDIQPILGVGDIVFAALYTVASRRHDLPMWRTIVALAIGLAMTLVVVVATGHGTPALPFLGAAIVIAHPSARRLPPEDRKKALGGLLMLIALFVVLFFFFR